MLAHNAQDGLERLSGVGEAGAAAAGEAAGGGSWLALLCVIFAAACGAATTIVPARPSPWHAVGHWARLGRRRRHRGRRQSRPRAPWLGKEAGWVQVRATAEGVKSECFRYAAEPAPIAAAELRRRKGRSRSGRRARKAGGRQIPHAPPTIPFPPRGDPTRADCSMCAKDVGTGPDSDRRANRPLQKGASQERSVRPSWLVAFAYWPRRRVPSAPQRWADIRAVIGAMTRSRLDRRLWPLAGAIISSPARRLCSRAWKASRRSKKRAPTGLADFVTTTRTSSTASKAWLPQMLVMSTGRRPAAGDSSAGRRQVSISTARCPLARACAVFPGKGAG